MAEFLYPVAVCLGDIVDSADSLAGEPWFHHLVVPSVVEEGSSFSTLSPTLVSFLKFLLFAVFVAVLVGVKSGS